MKRFCIFTIVLLISITIVIFISRPTDSQIEIPENWIHFEVSGIYDDSNGFIFLTPPDVIEIPVQGIDSKVGQFENDSIRIGFDYGWYSSDLSELEHIPKLYPNLKVQWIEIDGKEAKLVTSDTIAAIHFPEVESNEFSPVRLTMHAEPLTDDFNLETATTILKSIQFTRSGFEDYEHYD